MNSFISFAQCVLLYKNLEGKKKPNKQKQKPQSMLQVQRIHIYSWRSWMAYAYFASFIISLDQN